jgi:Protein phosphatase 2C
VITHTLVPEDEFLVIASDGLWDVLNSQRVVEFARSYLRQDNDPVSCSRQLVRAHPQTLNPKQWQWQLVRAHPQTLNPKQWQWQLVRAHPRLPCLRVRRSRLLRLLPWPPRREQRTEPGGTGCASVRPSGRLTLGATLGRCRLLQVEMAMSMHTSDNVTVQVICFGPDAPPNRRETGLVKRAVSRDCLSRLGDFLSVAADARGSSAAE